MNFAQAGWLDNLTNWLREQVERFWNALIQALQDALVRIVEYAMTAFAIMIESMPVPDFLTSYSLSTLFGGLPADLLYFLGFMRVDECLALIGSGYGFRLLRKLFTAGQW